MAATQHQLTPAAFDAAAASYDDAFTCTNIGAAQRNAVWHCLENIFCRGERILDIGCGTGIDACFLAERGVNVVACDSSSQMLAITRKRIGERRLTRRVHPILLRAEDIPTLQTSEPFDGAFSNFGALNCIKDARLFATNLSMMLKPGARAVLVWIGPCCLWEMVWYLGQRNTQKAFRRFRRKGIPASIADGPSFSVFYPSVRNLATAFSPEFCLRSIRGIGIAVPPSYMESWAARHSRLLHLFEKMDLVFGRVPGLRVLADHVLLEFERTDTRPISAVSPRTDK